MAQVNQNRWGQPWTVALVVIIFIALWSDIGKETFEPNPRTIVMKMFDYLQKKHIYITKKSIVSVRMDDIKVEKPQKHGMVTQIIQRKKAFSSRASAKPKFILSKGSVIVGKPVHIESQGETRDDAYTSARGAIDAVGKAMVEEAKYRGLMAE